MKELFQMSYGKPHGVWQSFNITPNASTKAVKFFETVANGCTPQNFDINELKKDNENYKLLFQVVSFSGQLGTIAVKYGIKDNAGRESMFANGYIYDASEGVLNDPHIITGISEDSFHFTVEEPNISTCSCKYGPVLNIEKAFEIANISKETFFDILACVYMSYSGQRNYPTYFKYNGSNEQIKAIIYLILCFLPHQLRYNIAFANANVFKNPVCKSFMFVSNIPNGGSFYEIETGNTNINLDFIEKYPKTFPFINFDVFNKDDCFDKLDLIIKKMNLSFNAEYHDLLIAQSILEKSTNPEIKFSVNIDEHVRDLFKKRLPESAFTDKYITQVLKNYYKSKVIPDNDLLCKIDERCKNTGEKGLVDIYRQLRASVLLKEGEQGVISFLISERERNVDDFKMWANFIKNCGGDEQVAQYYLSNLKKMSDIDKVEHWFKEYKEIVNKQEYYKTFNQKLLEICYCELQKRPEISGYYMSVLDHYASAFCNMFKTDMSCERLNSIVVNFWKQYDLNSFEFTEMYVENISYLMNDFKGVNKGAELLRDLYFKVALLKDNFATEEKNDALEFLEKLEATGLLNNGLVSKIQRFILDYIRLRANEDVLFWFNVLKISLKPREYHRVIKIMLTEKLPVLFDQSIADATINNITNVKDVDNLIVSIKGTETIKGYLDILNDPKCNEYKILKNYHNLLVKRKKEILKVEKKKQDAEDKNSNESMQNKTSSKKTFGDVWGSLFKRGK